MARDVQANAESLRFRPAAVSRLQRLVLVKHHCVPQPLVLRATQPCHIAVFLSFASRLLLLLHPSVESDLMPWSSATRACPGGLKHHDASQPLKLLLSCDPL